MAKIIRTTTKESITPERVEREVETLIIGNPKHDSNFTKLYPALFKAVMDDLSINNGRLRLLWFFIAKIQDHKPNHEPIVVANIDEMAEALHATVRSMKSYLRHLINKGYIFRKRDSTGKIYPNTYVVNPAYVYKGYAKQYFEEQRKKITVAVNPADNLSAATDEQSGSQQEVGTKPSEPQQESSGENKAASKKKRPSSKKK